MFKEERFLWEELKFEVHINSMLVQLLELASQLPQSDFEQIISNLHSKDEEIDISAYLVK